MIKTATTSWVVTHAAVDLDTDWAVTDAHAQVRISLKTSRISCEVCCLLLLLLMLLLFSDINECSSRSTNNCQQLCVNTDGSYTCQCRTGFTLNRNGRTCRGIMHMNVI